MLVQADPCIAGVPARVRFFSGLFGGGRSSLGDPSAVSGPRSVGFRVLLLFH